MSLLSLNLSSSVFKSRIVRCALFGLLFFVLVFVSGCAPKTIGSGKKVISSRSKTRVWVKRGANRKVRVRKGPVRYRALHSSASETAARRLDHRGQELSSWRQIQPQIRKSIEYVRRNPSSGIALNRPEIRLTWGQLRKSLEDLERILPRLDRDPSLLGRYFVWYELQSGAEMTGYFTPVIEASLTKRGPYKYPVYRKPPDLRKARPGQTHPWTEQMRKAYRVENGRILPYHSRREIDVGKVLSGRGLEVAWLKDPVDLFYMHVQGGGVLRLPDGRLRTAVFSGSNGRDFKGLGRILLERGILKRSQLSISNIKKYLLSNPKRMWELMAENESYIFFNITRTRPMGAIGKPLMPMVSLAADPGLIPLGAIVSYRVDLYPGPGRGARRVNGVGLAQDTGKAIKGARLDYYVGVGREKQFMANHLKNRVPVYLLVSRSALRR